jgi:tetratricopeptide (TPR) repeat protein
MKSLLVAVATDSMNCDAYFSLGSIYVKKRDYEKAAAMFDKRIECDPKSISLAAYLNGAASHMQIKNYPRTRELLTKTIELKPDFLQARLWLARYYSQVVSLDKARAESEVVLQQIDRTRTSTNEAAEAHYLPGNTTGSSSGPAQNHSAARRHTAPRRKHATDMGTGNAQTDRTGIRKQTLENSGSIHFPDYRP